MTAYTNPGVYVTESPLTSLVPTTGGVASAAFWGTADRGPTVATKVSDWTTYKSLFGDLNDNYDLGYAVYHFFANGGRNAYVTRVVSSTAVSAQTAAAVKWYPLATGAAGVAQDLMTVTASSPGLWGNKLSVKTLAGSSVATATNFPTFDFVVLLNGVEVERWTDVSPDNTANRYVESVVNTYSTFVKVSNVNPGNHPYHVDAVYQVAATTNLVGGTSPSVVDADYTTAFNSIDLVPGNLILNAVGQNGATVTGALVTKASTRGDSFVILDPDVNDVTFADIQTTVAAYSGIGNSSYAATYAPALLMVDPAKSGVGAIRATYPGGALAGLYVRTEVERSVAKAPAGYAADIRGALAPTVKLTTAQVGTLYNSQTPVNTFKTVAGAGVTVDGARTLQKANPDRFINVRRTLNYLKYSLKQLTEFAVFEANDPRLWTEVNVKVAGFLNEFWRSGGLKGERSNEAFFVVCDASNNTTASIDQGQLRVDVGVSLQYPAEFVLINISQWSGGSNAVDSL
jgi:phage tail sheath protein FI